MRQFCGARFMRFAATMLLAGCANGPAVHAQADAQAKQSNVVRPSISLEFRESTAQPGSTIVLVARPRGGEAMLFSVDWSVVEGPAGGVVQDRGRSADASHEARYTAPSVPGTYHVTATIREFPAATATAEIRVISSASGWIGPRN